MPDFDSELEAALPAVRALLRRLTGTQHDADDLSQEVWLRAHRYRDSFDTSGPIAGWLGRIAFRQFLDWRRTRDRAPGPLGDADRRAAAPRDDPDRREWIERRLTLLRPVERDVLLRFHRDGKGRRRHRAGAPHARGHRPLAPAPRAPAYRRRGGAMSAS